MTKIIESVPGHAIGDIALVSRCIDILDKHYPYFVWRIFIDDDQRGGVMRIINDTINDVLYAGCSYGYSILLREVYQDPNLHCIMVAGGEILERAALKRAMNNGDVPTYVEGVLQKHQPINVSRGIYG